FAVGGCYIILVDRPRQRDFHAEVAIANLDLMISAARKRWAFARSADDQLIGCQRDTEITGLHTGNLDQNQHFIIELNDIGWRGELRVGSKDHVTLHNPAPVSGLAFGERVTASK